MHWHQLANIPPRLDYDDSELQHEGYELKFALDARNEDYAEVIAACESRHLPYKVLQGEGKQRHVWIRDWKAEYLK